MVFCHSPTLNSDQQKMSKSQKQFTFSKVELLKITVEEMTDRCPNCDYTLYKLDELVSQYEELLQTKQQQIICSHRIIAELEKELKEAISALNERGLSSKEAEKKNHKIHMEQQDTIQYLKEREVILLEQLKTNQKEIFKLLIDAEDQHQSVRDFDNKQNLVRDFGTPIKTVEFSNRGNMTQNKSRNNSLMINKVLQQSTIKFNNSDCKDNFKLKVAEDQLQLMNIKYKMALLKNVEVATFR